MQIDLLFFSNKTSPLPQKPSSSVKPWESSFTASSEMLLAVFLNEFFCYIHSFGIFQTSVIINAKSLVWHRNFRFMASICLMLFIARNTKFHHTKATTRSACKVIMNP